MRKSTIFFGIAALQAVIALVLLVQGASVRQTAGPRMKVMAAAVSDLRLTDLCLFTEARYTRHPAMADINTAFQDYPFSFEHFPSGSLTGVPGVVRKR